MDFVFAGELNNGPMTFAAFPRGLPDSFQGSFAIIFNLSYYFRDGNYKIMINFFVRAHFFKKHARVDGKLQKFGMRKKNLLFTAKTRGQT